MAYWTIIGTSITDAPKSFGLNLDTDNKKWTVGGPSVDFFFVTRSGRYVITPAPELGVVLLKQSGERIAFFRNLHGGTPVGGTGDGRQDETGQTFKWKLDSI